MKEIKKLLRSKIKDLKKQYTKEEKKELSKPIFERLESKTWFKSSKIILLYWSMDDEVFTHDFILKWYKEKTILLPCVDGDDLRLRIFEGMDSMKVGECFSILEPVGEEFLDYEDIDLMIVPGIAFDKKGNRLGRGRGFYDRLLSITNSRKVGIGFDFQYLDHVPTEDFDIRMDEII